jgi:hypothetical protein
LVVSESEEEELLRKSTIEKHDKKKVPVEERKKIVPPTVPPPLPPAQVPPPKKPTDKEPPKYEKTLAEHPLLGPFVQSPLLAQQKRFVDWLHAMPLEDVQRMSAFEQLAAGSVFSLLAQQIQKL